MRHRVYIFFLCFFCWNKHIKEKTSKYLRLIDEKNNKEKLLWAKEKDMLIMLKLGDKGIGKLTMQDITLKYSEERTSKKRYLNLISNT